MGPRQNRVSVALIGYGMGGALFHAPFIAADPRLDLAVVVTANDERRRAVLSRYPGTDVLGRDRGSSGPPRRVRPRRHIDAERHPRRSGGGGALAGKAGRGRQAGHPVGGRDTAGWPRWRRNEAHGWSPSRTGAGTATFGPSWTFCAATDLGVLHAFESRYERWQPQVSVDPGRAWKNDGQPGAGDRHPLRPGEPPHRPGRRALRPTAGRLRRRGERRPSSVWTTTSSSPSTTRAARGCTCG